jgi:phosphatidate cytidylyltransferase
VPADLVHAPWAAAGASYLAVVLVVVAVSTLVAIVVLGLAGRGGANPRTLLARWATWIVLALVWALVCLSGPLPVAVLMTAFAVLGLREFGRLTELPRSHRLLLYTAALGCGALALEGAGALLAMIPIVLLVGATQPVVAVDVHRGIRHLAFGALAFGYLPLLLAHGVLIARDVTEGGLVLFVLGAAVAFSDIGAYVTGRTLGKHKLSPVLSPNKTVEGLIGNLFGAGLAYALFTPIYPAVAPWVMLGLPVLVAVGAVWGDLFESALKREFGVKDAGGWLPGFGGLLDRIDSLIIVIPLTYYGLGLAGRFVTA